MVQASLSGLLNGSEAELSGVRLPDPIVQIWKVLDEQNFHKNIGPTKLERLSLSNFPKLVL